jgi:hypothetical protein
MYSARRGQTQVFTAVLLGGILIAGVPGAYVWGLPILQKNQDVNNAEQSLSDLKQLSNAVSTVATGVGSSTVTVWRSDGTLNSDAEEATITYRTVTQVSFVSSRLWVPLTENDMRCVNRSTGMPDEGYGIRGVDEPALVVGRAQQTSNGFSTTYRVVLRDLLDTSTGQTYRVELEPDGNLEASQGRREVVLRSGQDGTRTGEGIDGGTLQTQKVLVRVS